jgi:hypothetical protein
MRWLHGEWLYKVSGVWIFYQDAIELLAILSHSDAKNHIILSKWLAARRQGLLQLPQSLFRSGTATRTYL